LFKQNFSLDEDLEFNCKIKRTMSIGGFDLRGQRPCLRRQRKTSSLTFNAADAT